MQREASPIRRRETLGVLAYALLRRRWLNSTIVVEPIGHFSGETVTISRWRGGSAGDSLQGRFASQSTCPSWIDSATTSGVTRKDFSLPAHDQNRGKRGRSGSVI